MARGYTINLSFISATSKIDLSQSSPQLGFKEIVHVTRVKVFENHGTGALTMIELLSPLPIRCVPVVFSDAEEISVMLSCFARS